MKKMFLVMLVLCLTFVSSTAIAEPTASPSNEPSVSISPSPSFSSGSMSTLIKYKDTGEPVVRIQMRLRELGYFAFKPTGNFQTMSMEAVIAFQQRQLDANGKPIISDGTVGTQSMEILFSPSAARAEIVAGIPVGPSLQGTASVVGVFVDWSEVKQLLGAGVSYMVTDYNTGTQFSLTYAGGENHAEMEASTATDSIAIKEVFGGDFSFFKRPAVIKIGDKNIAASLQGYPHGSDSVSANDMDGHLCLYFNGSLSHVSNLPDAEHAAQIYKAAGRDN
ncbi:MAG TPA: peptidoglycan-binding domain-containing protein [Clostridia bacterium]|nr:peptidoglycan-binding domain-containing protein [Clostridia bacterium]